MKVFEFKYHVSPTYPHNAHWKTLKAVCKGDKDVIEKLEVKVFEMAVRHVLGFGFDWVVLCERLEIRETAKKKQVGTGTCANERK